MSINNIKKYWGKNPHPVIDEINKRLFQLGFAEKPTVEKESASYAWTSRISDTLQIQFTISPKA